MDALWTSFMRPRSGTFPVETFGIREVSYFLRIDVLLRKLLEKLFKQLVFPLVRSRDHWECERQHILLNVEQRHGNSEWALHIMNQL